MTINLSAGYNQLERDFWAALYQASGGDPIPPQTPHNEVVKMGMTMDQDLAIPKDADREAVERLWLEKALAGEAQSQRIPDLWLQFAAKEGINIVAKPWRQARHEWYVANNAEV